MMRARICCFLVMYLTALSLVAVGVPSKHFAPNDGFPLKNQGKPRSPQSLLTAKSPNEIEGMMKKEVGLSERGGKYKEMKEVGSKPPSCEHKCYGCTPCEAIQVPTTTTHLGVQYTNYEPEGWKCKCGHSFYSP